jgi:flagellar hook protein FlgE
MVGSVPSATSSALAGIRNSLRRMDRAAAVISGAGVTPEEVSPTASGVAPGSSTSAEMDLAGSMVDLLMAQRAFSAQLRVLETARQTADEALTRGSNHR